MTVRVRATVPLTKHFTNAICPGARPTASLLTIRITIGRGNYIAAVNQTANIRRDFSASSTSAGRAVALPREAGPRC